MTPSQSLQRRYWNGLADEYRRITRIDPEDFHYGPQLPGEGVLRLLPPLRPGMRALELGCGAAQNSLWLARRGLVCTALDISAEQLRHARDLAAGLPGDPGTPSPRFIEAPLEDFPHHAPGPFELVHSSHAMEFADDPAAVLRAVAAALAPGGHFVMSTVHPLYNGDWIGGEEADDDPDAGFAVADEDGHEVRGLFLTNYFSPPDDIRRDDEGHPVVVSHAYPISSWFRWLRDAGLRVVRLEEPRAVFGDEAPAAYTSDAWAEPDGELDAIPATVVFVAEKPATPQPAPLAAPGNLW